MQGKVIYRFVAERQDEQGYYIAISRWGSTADQSLPVKVEASEQELEPVKANNHKAAAAPAISNEVSALDELKDTGKDAGKEPKENQNIAVRRRQDAFLNAEAIVGLTQDAASNTIAPPLFQLSELQEKGGKKDPRAYPNAMSASAAMEQVNLAPVKEGDTALIDFSEFAKEDLEVYVTVVREENFAHMDDILAGNLPIELDKTTHQKHDKQPPNDWLLGELVIMNLAGPGQLEPRITERTQDDGFHIYYERSEIVSKESGVERIRPDDAAMIVRAFMLAKMATARLELRETLQSQTRDWKSLTQEQEQKGHLDTMLTLWHRLEEEEKKRHADKDEGGSGHRHEKKHAPPSLWEQRLLLLENWLADKSKSRHNMFDERRLGLYIVNTGLFILAIFWVWVPYLFEQGWLMFTVLGWFLTFALSAGGLVFLRYALNLKPLKHRIQEKLHEATTEKLNRTMADLVQTNANVAAVNLTPEPLQGPVSELLLGRMDQALHLKERLVSIEHIVKAREVHLSENLTHIEKHRDRVRRSITAAGSGVFVGFFTYEVGESVMHYLHVAHHQDEGAMLYWLAANSERIKVRPGLAAPEPGIAAAPAGAAHAGPAAPPGGEHGPVAGHLETVVAPHDEHHAPEMDGKFIASFHQPELYAHSWLLTLTILFSVLTAWIAIRKPEAEQGGGHGHH